MGTRLAACAWVVLALPTVGCLVTNKVEFDEGNVPANLRDQRPATFTRVPSVQDLDPRCTVGLMRFEARVYDANIEDALESRLVINGELAPETEDEIPPGDTADRGPLIACARISRLTRACNRVEMCVSRKFRRGANPYETEDPDDLAKVEWWVLGQAGSVPQADPEDCAELLDGGVP